jgi:iron complex outermembrane receptor protein
MLPEREPNYMLSTTARPPQRDRRPAAAAGLLLLGAGPLLAQQPSPADSAARRDSATTLAPVTVTVLQTPFDLARVPYAVSAVGEAELQRGRPGFNLAEGLVAVPGVQVDNRFNFALGERISIRGFGARAQFGVRGVRVLIDGIPATMPDGQTTLNHVDVASLGRAEVIRGPASAIYGNASGGVLQFESEAPPDQPIEQRARALAGSDGLARFQSTTAGRVDVGGTPVGYGVNVSRLTYGGYRAWNDAQNSYAALNLRTELGATQLRVTGHFADYEGRNAGSLTDSLVRVNRAQAFQPNQVRWRAGEEGRHQQLGAELRRGIAGGELRVNGYALGRTIDNPIPQVVVALGRRAGGARAAYALPLQLGGLPLQVIAGVQTDLQRDDRRNFANDTGRRAALQLDQRERVTATAGFAQLSLEAVRGLSVLGALRYDRTAFGADDRLVSATDPDNSGDRTMTAASPSVGVSWAFGGVGSLYANYSSAFETPTTTELVNQPTGVGGLNPQLGPQRTRSFEVGTTGRLGSRATAQVAAYRARVRDALIPFEVPGAPGRQFFRNAGSAVHQGVETGATLALGSAITARAAYTYTDARFDDYVVGTTSFADKQVPGVAPHRADAVLTYLAPRGLVLELEERYVSAVPTNDANAAGTESPGYALTNARVTSGVLRLGGAQVKPFAGVTNLFDRLYNSSVTVNAFGRRYFEPGAGRSIYLGIEAVAR